MLLLHLEHLLGDAEAQLVHAVVPLDCEFLEFFPIIKLHLLRLLIVLLHQTVLYAFLRVFANYLDVLELGVGVDVLPTISQLHPLLIKLIDEIAHIIYELLLLNNRLALFRHLRRKLVVFGQIPVPAIILLRAVVGVAGELDGVTKEFVGILRYTALGIKS